LSRLSDRRYTRNAQEFRRSYVQCRSAQQYVQDVKLTQRTLVNYYYYLFKFKIISTFNYMATLTTLYDSRENKFFTEDESPQSCNDTVKITDDSFELQVAIVEPILARANFTDTEYAVLFALLIWQIDVLRSARANRRFVQC
ncbi:hypothetical protein PENTCL1PPCAC_5334, partial [Pristionchus entomophagus]